MPVSLPLKDRQTDMGAWRVNAKVRKRAEIRNGYNQVPPDPGYQLESDKLTVIHHRSALSQQVTIRHK